MALTDKEFYDSVRKKIGAFSPSQFNNFEAILKSQYRENLIAALIPNALNIGGLRLSENGVKKIAGFEGVRTKAYPDSAGIWTLGIGTIRYPDGSKVKKGDTCTVEQAYSWFRDYIQGVETFIHRVIKVKLNQNQFDALVSLIYNIGETAFTGGSVDDKLNAGNFKAATETWLLYNKAGGKVIDGLKSRRRAEVAWFNSAT